jgi:hypothetical protein
MVELGTQGIYFSCRIAWRRERRTLFHLVPWKFDINPRVTLVGKILCWHNTLHLVSQRHQQRIVHRQPPSPMPVEISITDPKFLCRSCRQGRRTPRHPSNPEHVLHLVRRLSPPSGDLAIPHLRLSLSIAGEPHQSSSVLARLFGLFKKNLPLQIIS